MLKAKRLEKEQSMTFPKEGEYKVEADNSDRESFPHQGEVNFSSPTYDQSTGTILGACDISQSCR